MTPTPCPACEQYMCECRLRELKAQGSAPTREMALAALREADAVEYGSPKDAHEQADEALCAFLEGLGYGEVVAAFRGITKWYD